MADPQDSTGLGYWVAGVITAIFGGVALLSSRLIEWRKASSKAIRDENLATQKISIEGYLVAIEKLEDRVKALEKICEKLQRDLRDKDALIERLLKRLASEGQR